GKSSTPGETSQKHWTDFLPAAEERLANIKAKYGDHPELVGLGEDAAGPAEGMTRVGRWMSPAELKAMQETGVVQEGAGGVHRVAVPVDPTAYKAAPPGDLFVTYDVPTTTLKNAGQDNWRLIPGPNSPHARLAAKKGEPIPQLPRFQNLKVEMKK